MASRPPVCEVMRPIFELLARALRPHLLDLIQHLREVVACRILQRRETRCRTRVPSATVAGRWAACSSCRGTPCSGTAIAPPMDNTDFWSSPTACSNGSRRMFCTWAQPIGLWARKSGGTARAFHREVDLPVLVPHRRRGRPGVVEEDVARRRVRRAGQVVELVDALELGLDDAGVLPRHDLGIEVIALGAARDLDECRQPVVRREDLGPAACPA